MAFEKTQGLIADHLQIRILRVSQVYDERKIKDIHDYAMNEFMNRLAKEGKHLVIETENIILKEELMAYL